MSFRIRATPLQFSVLFTSFLYATCNALDIDRLARWFPGTRGAALLPFTAFLAAGYCLFLACFLLLAHRRTIKPVALVLCVLSAAATYFVAKYDAAIDSSMILNALHTDATEVRQLLSVDMLPYAALLIVLPASFILLARIEFDGSPRYLGPTLGSAGLAVLVAAGCLFANREAIQRAGNVSNKYILYSLVPDDLLYGGINLASKALASVLPSRRIGDNLHVSIERPENLVVVLAVGESSRRDSFSLYGYAGHDTTPRLDRIPELRLLDGVARRASTIYALPQILEKDGVKLTQIVSKAGVPEACFVNFSLYDNCGPAREIGPSNCAHGGHCYDEDVLPLLQRQLDRHSNGKELIVLHFGGGSHGPIYRDRHPPEFLRFQPTCDDADVANRCSPQQLHNAYDNTILYVDYVVSDAIRRLEAAKIPYVFVYLSDHGESLMEGGHLFHGVPPGMSLPPEQARIPLLVKSSVPLSVEPRTEYSQPDVFDSILDVLSIHVDGMRTAGGFLRRH